MFKRIEGLPPDVMAIEAVGTVTHEDYRTILIPGAEALMAAGPIKMLYVIGPEFAGFEFGALWDDALFGRRHWSDFKRVAVVADESWVRAAVAMFMPIFPCAVKLFKLADLDQAKAWISAA
jgi:hypothetical protein